MRRRRKCRRFLRRRRCLRATAVCGERHERDARRAAGGGPKARSAFRDAARRGPRNVFERSGSLARGGFARARPLSAMLRRGSAVRLSAQTGSVDLSTRCKSFLRAQFGKREASTSATPSGGPANGILRAETGGRFRGAECGERSEFGSQTAIRLANRPELRGFLSTRKPRWFAETAWWGMQGSN